MKHIKGAAIGFGFGLAMICFVVGVVTIIAKLAVGIAATSDSLTLAFIYSIVAVCLTTIIGAMEGA